MMASTRNRSDSRSRGGESSRSRRTGGVMEASNDELSSSLTRAARGEPDKSRLGIPASTQPRIQSRIPLTPSTRKLSNSSTTRPSLTHESQSWGSTSSGRSATMALPTPMPLARDKMINSKQPRNVLRRKQSGIPHDISSLRDNSRTSSGRTSSSSSIPKSQISRESDSPQLDRSITASPVEIQVAQNAEMHQGATQTTIYPELDRYRNVRVPRAPQANDILFKLATEDLPPPTPLFSGSSSHSQLSAFSASPSTVFADSPGPGPYSRDTTPTSMSSVSPGLIAPLRHAMPRIRQESPADTRPPVTRRRAPSVPTDNEGFASGHEGLAAVREASLSSSSRSTAHDGERSEKKKRKKALPEDAPNPPPRKSSQKFKKDKEGQERGSPSKPSRKPAQPVMSPVGTSERLLSTDQAQRPFTSPQPRVMAPRRPSRDGTPELYSQFNPPAPVVHSNLSSTSLSDRRQSAQLAPSSLPRSTTPSSLHEREKPARQPLGRDATPAPRPSGSSINERPRNDAPRPTRTPSPSIPTFKSRFGLFSRRTKTDTEVSQVDNKEKAVRKGPAAGTGYEGYGRVGAVRRRSSSNGANAPRGLSGPISSSDSLSAGQAQDPFLLQRMNPVVIAGGEIIENRNTSSELARTDSEQSLSAPRPSTESRNGSAVSISSREDARHTLWPSAFPRSSPQPRRPSDSSDSEALNMKSTLAFRRSVQRLRSSPDQQPLRLPKPIVTRGMTSPSVGSIDTSILSDDSTASPKRGASRGRDEKAITGPKKLTKRAKSPRKWNIFSKSHGQPAADSKKETSEEVAAAVNTGPSKSVAFYTMMDSSEQEDVEAGVAEALRAAEVLTPPGMDFQKRRPSVTSQQDQASPQKPTLPMASTVVPHAPVHSQHVQPPSQHLLPPTQPPSQTTQSTSTGRPSRLPQVGRIPKVVNTRPDQTSPKSFSRPFNRISLQLVSSQSGTIDNTSVAKGASPPRPSTPELSRDGSSLTTGESNSPPKEHLGATLAVPEPKNVEKEFLSFTPRKGSECTTSSASSNSGLVSYAPHTAVIPAPSAPLAEDEIWDEYNDLLGEVPLSATSSRGVPFHLDGYQSRLVKKHSKPMESPTIQIHLTQDIKDSRDSVDTTKAATASSHFSDDMTARINAAFRFGSEPPSTPFSVSEFVSGYGDQDMSLEPTPESKPAPKAQPAEPQRDSASSQRSRKTRASSSSSSSEETPLSQVNLRVGSMTVSKWLTFGHVLFSPAREDLVPVVGSLKRHSILVIDGLGNDDWSFYAAETYPAATFFNLSPRAPLAQDHRTSTTSFPMSPPNHHQIQYMSHMDKFPFGEDSFTTVVFRFPSAAPEAHFRNIVMESRRVLKPGGYMELSILDVDLNNMGNRTRRAVRRLKERVSTKNSDCNLSSTADMMLRLMGKRGFVDIKSCRVGVPVASAIAHSSGSEGSNKKDERSLAEMMNDETEMGDENITKMVAKVGRWWYNRLYEAPTGSGHSMWNDRSLLGECEEWQTSLKLMVCHAKIPESRGRVSSI